jgi:hypothetical protein
MTMLKSLAGVTGQASSSGSATKCGYAYIVLREGILRGTLQPEREFWSGWVTQSQVEHRLRSKQPAVPLHVRPCISVP